MKISARTSEKIAKIVIWSVAVAVIGALISIMGFILIRGLPAINWSFLTQDSYDMGRGGGIRSAIVGTLWIIVLAVGISLPFGIGTAFYLAEYTKGGIVPRIIRFGAESLAGIPSIVYGLFGFIFFVDILGLGWSALAGGLTVAIMVLPTIIRTSEEAILAVPKIYREASFSLGATKWQTIRCAVTPSAIRGISNGIILSIGRCIAETAAVMLTAGSALRLATTPLSSTRTMAVHFYMLATEGTAMDNAYGTAAILIILIFTINVGLNAAVNRFVSKKNKGAR
jgi:phosphate transport system permease protein